MLVHDESNVAFHKCLDTHRRFGLLELGHLKCSIFREKKCRNGRFRVLETHFGHWNGHSETAWKCDSAKHIGINTSFLYGVMVV